MAEVEKKTWLPFAYGRMPGWAISLTVALVATCISVLAIAGVYSANNKHRQEEYANCLANQKGITQFIDVFSKLRDADQLIIDTASQSPNNPLGTSLLNSAKARVTAYDELLTLAAKGQKVDCSNLK